MGMLAVVTKVVVVAGSREWAVDEGDDCHHHWIQQLTLTVDLIYIAYIISNDVINYSMSQPKASLSLLQLHLLRALEGINGMTHTTQLDQMLPTCTRSGSLSMRKGKLLEDWPHWLPIIFVERIIQATRHPWIWGPM